MKKLICMIACVFTFASLAQAQYPQTMWIKVTFYDFHSDKSNPEFEQNHLPGVHPGMVGNTLNAQRNPVLGPSPLLNYGIAKWFVPWTPGDFVIPSYRTDATGIAYDGTSFYLGPKTVNYDTAFKNVVIVDSLPFNHLGGGLYQYTNQAFFMLDNRGLGNEGLDHNFAFTMAIHDTFTYQRGLTFNFEGDDDVWAFIDGRLAMDLGSLHGATPGAFNVDDIPGLVVGARYAFDFFYAERHTVASDIKITTNILAPKIAHLTITTDPPLDTIPAGTTLSAIATVLDDTNGVRTEFLPRVTWTLIDTAGNPPLSAPSGGRVTFTPTEAFCDVYIIGTLVDSVNGIILKDTVKVYVTAGPADHVVIEADQYGRTRSPRNDNPVGGNSTVTIGSTELSKNVYATLRDKYGNYVGQSKSTQWDTLKIIVPNVVSVTPGNQALGEGVIRKLGTADSTRVRAKTLDIAGNPMDTITVFVSNITYDSLRIVIRTAPSPTRIYSLTMNTEQDTIIAVQGLRTAINDWVDVPGNWSLTASLTSSIPPPTGQITWQFSPSNTGNGVITVTYAGKTTSIPVTILPGPPRALVLYPKEGAPSASNKPYPRDTSMIAGVDFPLVAKIFDHQSVWLDSLEGPASATLISWKLSDPTLGTLTAPTGYKTTFRSTLAHNSVEIMATYTNGINVFADTVRVAILPAAASQLVIEANKDQNLSPNHASPLDTLTINYFETSKSVYAILRDTFGNWVGFSQQTLWTSQDNAVALAENGIQFQGEGIVTRMIDSGSTIVNAKNTEARYAGLNLNDDVFVKIANIFYRELRIVVGDSTDITNLDMNTNQDTTLKVQGLRSDNGQWEYVYARWDMKQGLVTAPMPPSQADKWTFSPVAPGTGWILVTMDNDSTRPDSVIVNFTRGPITDLNITLITPPERRIAGDTLLAVVEIRNKDGLVPGSLCFDGMNGSEYQDALGTGGGKRPPPFVIGDNGNVVITQAGTAANKTDECFQNGIDTVKFVLYYAPLGDTSHQIFVHLADRNATTVPFKLLPGPLDSLALEDVNGNPQPDSLRLVAPNDSRTIAAAGYDPYGNRRGPENSTWTTSNTLHPVPNADNVSRIFYETGSVQNSEDGWLKATAAGGVKDSMFINVVGLDAYVYSAVTKDADGDGLLDQIVVYYNKKVTLPSDPNFLNTIRAVAGSLSFSIDSIGGGLGRSDSIFTLHLHETDNGRPQTSLTPLLTITGVPKARDLDNFLTTDGAGPVIWTVTKTINSISDRTLDKVTVIFSEKVFDKDGGSFKLNNQPGLVFTVWKKDSALGFVEVPFVLDGIFLFAAIVNDSTVKFDMLNGKDLMSSEYLSISDDKQVMDQKGKNFPQDDNRKVPVYIEFKASDRLVPVPNPSRPTFTREDAGDFIFVHNSNARDWVRTDRAGTVFTFDIPPTSDTVRGYIKIYDLVGNLVNEASTENVIRSLNIDSQNKKSAYTYDIYWNGSNKQGQKVSAGAYSVGLFLSNSTKPLWTTVGIVR
jgi:fibro-slime domain-containing protein